MAAAADFCRVDGSNGGTGDVSPMRRLTNPSSRIIEWKALQQHEQHGTGWMKTRVKQSRLCASCTSTGRRRGDATRAARLKVQTEAYRRAVHSHLHGDVSRRY